MGLLIGDGAPYDEVIAAIQVWAGKVDGVNADEKGTPLPCTKENVIAVLVAAPWIREEVEAAMNDHARFFGKA